MQQQSVATDPFVFTLVVMETSVRVPCLYKELFLLKYLLKTITTALPEKPELSLSLALRGVQM